MKDEKKTKAQLIKELNDLRRSLVELEKPEAERKEAEEVFQESEKKYRKLFENASVGIFHSTPEGLFLRVNQALAAMLGYGSPDDLVSSVTNIATQIYVDSKIHPKILTTTLKEQGWVFAENQYRRKDGSIMIGSLAVRKELNTDGTVKYLEGFVEDITVQKQAEEDLLKEKKFIDTVLNSLPGMFYLIDEKGRFLRWNRNFESITGYSAEEMSKMSPLDLFAGEEKQLVAEKIQEVFMKGQSSVEAHVVIKDGRTPQYFFTGLRFQSDNRRYLIGMGIDITEKNQAQAALRESEEKYRNILETIEDSYYEVDPNGNLTFFNDAMTRIHERPRDELMGMNNRQYTDPENAIKLYRAFNQVYRTGEPSKATEYEVIAKNGERKSLETSISLMKDSSGDFIGFRGVTRDITELRRAQRALQTSEERFRVAAESSNDFIYEWDLNTAQIEWFGVATEKLNYLLGKIPITATAFGKIIHPDDYDRFLEPIRRHLRHGGAYKEEYRMVGKEGRIVHVKVAGMGLRNQEGRVYKWIGAISDISEQKKTEEEIKQSLEKLHKVMGGIIQAMALTVESKDPYTAGHQQRVSNLARTIAQEMGLSKDQVEAIRMAGVVHDLGKISVPAEILSKPIKLSDLEFSLIRQHPQTSYDILKDIDFPWPIAEIVLQHHERMNGSGYPSGLKGDEILIEAQVLIVADVVEAIASHRPYRPAHGIDVALEEIEKNKGTLYDPEVVDVCLRLFKEKGFKLE